MMSNVAEWVADCQHPDYQGALTDGSAWRDGCETEGDDFITRSGSFAASRQVLRSAARAMRAAPTPAAWAKASACRRHRHLHGTPMHRCRIRGGAGSSAAARA
jgi:formylglycine-generating enzyme required for sulfatase activity